MTSGTDHLSIREVAALTGFSYHKLNNYLKKGLIRAIPGKGRERVFDYDCLRAFSVAAPLLRESRPMLAELKELAGRVGRHYGTKPMTATAWRLL